jgi:flavorubredoxin
MATGLWLIEPRALLPGLAVAAVMFAIWHLIYEVGITGSMSREVVSEVKELGGDGRAGQALIVYHAGRSGFQTDMQHALAEGLQTQGWRVDITTASHATPTDLSSYQLLVLGAPTYNFRPARPVIDYLERLGNLSGRPVVLVLSGGGLTDGAMRTFATRVTELGGRIVKRIEVWTQRPNEERYDINDPREIMRRAGKGLRAQETESTA